MGHNVIDIEQPCLNPGVQNREISVGDWWENVPGGQG